MRIKFKPNVSVTRGTNTAGTGASGSGEAGGGVKSGGGETKKRRQRQRSRGDESGGTEGESSSELETGTINAHVVHCTPDMHAHAYSSLVGYACYKTVVLVYS